MNDTTELYIANKLHQEASHLLKAFPVHSLPWNHGWIEHLVGATFLQDQRVHTLQNRSAPT